MCSGALAPPTIFFPCPDNGPEQNQNCSDICRLAKGASSAMQIRRRRKLGITQKNSCRKGAKVARRPHLKSQPNLKVCQSQYQGVSEELRCDDSLLEGEGLKQTLQEDVPSIAVYTDSVKRGAFCLALPCYDPVKMRSSQAGLKIKGQRGMQFACKTVNL